MAFRDIVLIVFKKFKIPKTCLVHVIPNNSNKQLWLVKLSKRNKERDIEPDYLEGFYENMNFKNIKQKYTDYRYIYSGPNYM